MIFGIFVVGDDHRVQAGDLLGDEDALLEAAVGQLQAGHDVADRVDVRQVGVQPLVGDDEAAVHGDAGLFVAAAGGVRAAADRDQQQVGVSASSPSSRVTVTPESSWVTPWNRTPVLKAILRLRNARSTQLGRPRVLERDQGRQRLDDGHLGAERGPDRGELDADDAAAEHDRLLRDPLQAQRLRRR